MRFQIRLHTSSQGSSHPRILLLQLLLFAVGSSFHLSSTKISSHSSSNVAFTQRHGTALFSSRHDKDLSTTRRSLLWSSFVALTLAAWDSNAGAYDKTFPDQLDAVDGIIDERQRKINRVLAKQMQEQRKKDSAGVVPASSVVGATLWGSALWLLGGSRSNPVITPLANLLYDQGQEDWLKDRNEGLFANVPLPLFGALLIVFLILGWGADALFTALADANHNTSLQLAGVSVIGGATLELGRLASGEKRLTRVESDREDQLAQEFRDFADQRLKLGGNCHRLDVVRAFRRYYAKYRQPDNPDYPLSDLEIEQLLRSWGRSLGGVEMSSAGFYTGIQINQDADVFVQR